MYSSEFCAFTSGWFKKYMLDESVKADHEDLISLYQAFIEEIKANQLQSSEYNKELEIRRIIEKLINDCNLKEFMEDHMRLRIQVAQLDQELKSLVHISEKGFSKRDWWNYTFI
jgi:hypothetical protein